jgi:Rrf2 family iron-sulfur cluster assembly transcriptional regulator
MRLGTRGRYAVMAMTDLAGRQDALEGRAVALADIAQRQEISLSYLEQLFARLRRRSLVVSARGPGGGYRLAKRPDEIMIADIIMAVDEPMRATRCNAKTAKGCMSRGERCVTHHLWDEMGRRIQGYLASVSLADVLDGRLGDTPAEGRSAA